MTYLILRDECTASEDRKPPELVLTSDDPRVFVTGDRIYSGEVELRRVEPVGLGDVHWEYGDADHRFTSIEIQP